MPAHRPLKPVHVRMFIELGDRTGENKEVAAVIAEGLGRRRAAGSASRIYHPTESGQSDSCPSSQAPPYSPNETRNTPGPLHPGSTPILAPSAASFFANHDSSQSPVASSQNRRFPPTNSRYDFNGSRTTR